MTIPGIYSLSINDQEDIMSCIAQHINKRQQPNEFHAISVWYPDVANMYFNSNTPDGAFLIKYKYESNYTIPEIIEHAKKIWDAGLMPIEIVQNTGAYFFALPRDAVMDKNISHLMMLKAEHDIPSLNDF